jgi:hypothetical protein
MCRLSLFLVFVVLMLLPGRTVAQPACTAAPLSEQQVADVIAKARTEQKNELPPKFPESEVVFRKEGCHYVYIEYARPRTPDKQNIFRVNQHGVIVDVEPGAVRCPEKQFTEEDLAAVVAKARATRKDLPAPLTNSRIRVDRRRCLYLYFEYAVPDRPGDFQVFTIDPFGELLDAYRSKPYGSAGVAPEGVSDRR